jgi:hypothetical protein
MPCNISLFALSTCTFDLGCAADETSRQTPKLAQDLSIMFDLNYAPLSFIIQLNTEAIDNALQEFDLNVDD